MKLEYLIPKVISTHTLTWSVTLIYLVVIDSILISTHTLTWSVTVDYAFIICKNRISTHTLTWSVTISISFFEVNNIYFNSHAHVERDRLICQLIGKFCNFNSHAHVERDPRSFPNFRRACHFNSHAHVERDTGGTDAAHKFRISTHTLTWSVTFSPFLLLHQESISTHTLTWSVTGINHYQNAVNIFQLTRSRGA